MKNVSSLLGFLLPPAGTLSIISFSPSAPIESPKKPYPSSTCPTIVYYDCYIAFPDTADIEMMGIFARGDGMTRLGSISGTKLDEEEIVGRNGKDGVVTQLETYGLDGNAYSWTNNSSGFVYAL